jgi:hypothetical protein
MVDQQEIVSGMRAEITHLDGDWRQPEAVQYSTPPTAASVPESLNPSLRECPACARERSPVRRTCSIDLVVLAISSRDSEKPGARPSDPLALRPPPPSSVSSPCSPSANRSHRTPKLSVVVVYTHNHYCNHKPTNIQTTTANQHPQEQQEQAEKENGDDPRRDENQGLHGEGGIH